MSLCTIVIRRVVAAIEIEVGTFGWLAPILKCTARFAEDWGILRIIGDAAVPILTLDPDVMFPLRPNLTVSSGLVA